MSTGDAIKDYPNLTNIPPIAWKQTVYNTGIYGVPIPRPYVQGIWYVNQSRFESVGAGQPKDGAEFKQILQQLTNPAASQEGISGDATYAFGLTGIGLVPRLAMFHVPSDWKVDSSGKFIKDIETRSLPRWRTPMIKPIGLRRFPGVVRTTELRITPIE